MPLHQLFLFEHMMNFPEVFASTPNRIPIFWANITNTFWSEVNQLELFVFLIIYGSKSNNYSTLMHTTWIRWIKICLITRKWPKIIQYLPECYSLSASSSNHHFFALPLFNLGYRGLLFASTSNLEAGPRFTDIC